MNGKPTISVCLICCNEEKNIKDCLDSLTFADEVIVIDTGSTDNTIRIAKSYLNVKLYCKKFNVYYFKKFKRLFHYSNARNYSLSKANKEWILIIDADERVVNPEHFYKLIKEHPHIDAWRILQISQVDANKNNSETVEVPVSNTRLWKNGLGIRYEKIVHETVDIYLQEQGLKIGSSDIRINHVGFKDEKYNRQKALQIIDALEYERSYYHNYYIAIAYNQAGMLEKSIEYFYKAVQDTMPDNIKAHAWAVLADINRQKGNFYYRLAGEAVEFSLKLAPEQNLSHVIKSEMLKKFGHTEEAKQELFKLKDNHPVKNGMHQDLMLDKKQIVELVNGG